MNDKVLRNCAAKSIAGAVICQQQISIVFVKMPEFLHRVYVLIRATIRRDRRTAWTTTPKTFVQFERYYPAWIEPVFKAARARENSPANENGLEIISRGEKSTVLES